MVNSFLLNTTRKSHSSNIGSVNLFENKVKWGIFQSFCFLFVTRFVIMLSWEYLLTFPPLFVRMEPVTAAHALWHPALLDPHKKTSGRLTVRTSPVHTNTPQLVVKVTLKPESSCALTPWCSWQDSSGIGRPAWTLHRSQISTYSPPLLCVFI